jgi:aspartyl-tRNA(Asn)/glutamyl-tRNA(Gln) amidotransferase subunit B
VAVQPEQIAELAALVEDGTITSTAAKSVFEKMYETGAPPKQVVEELGLASMSDDTELRSIVERAIAANAKAVADYRAGKVAAVGAIVGGVMRETKNRANPDRARALIMEELNRA